MVILSEYLDKINLDDVNFDEDSPETIIHVTIMVQCNRFKQRKVFKIEINKELMSVAWPSTRWWDWCLLENEKRNLTIFDR